MKNIIIGIFAILAGFITHSFRATPASCEEDIYSRFVTIEGSIKTTYESNFPVLVSGTYSYLATAANGGNVQNVNGVHVDSCINGMAALEILRSDAPYDVIIANNDLPRVSGLELVLRVRSMVHRRNTPIIMLSGDDCEKEAWRAGVDAFLRKPEAFDQLSSTIARLLEEHRERRD